MMAVPQLLLSRRASVAGGAAAKQWKQQGLQRKRTRHRRYYGGGGGFGVAVSYLRDVVRSRSWNPTNPFLDNLRILQREPQEDDGGGCTQSKPSPTSPGSFPNLSPVSGGTGGGAVVEPRHAASAARQVASDRLSRLERLLLRQREREPHDDVVADHNDNSSLSRLREMLREYDDAETAALALQRMTTLLWLLLSSSSDNEAASSSSWQSAVDDVLSVLEEPPDDPNDETTTDGGTAAVDELIKRIRTLRDEVVLAQQQNQQSEEQADDQEAVLRAAEYVVQARGEETGSFGMINDDGGEGDRFRAFHKYGRALHRVELELQQQQQRSGSSKRRVKLTQPLASGMYGYVGIRTERSRLLGYANFADQVLTTSSSGMSEKRTRSRRRIASVDDVELLHRQVSELTRPYLDRVAESAQAGRLDEYLSRSGPPSSDATASSQSSNDQHRVDEREMIRLERHVTLDGALRFASRLFDDLLGLALVEEADPSDVVPAKVWDRDVRLFHVYSSNNDGGYDNGGGNDDDGYIGSFYLDPFRRDGKLNRPVTSPILARRAAAAAGDSSRAGTAPVVCVSLAIEPPVWDTDPAALTWADTEALFHELGHAVDYLTANVRYGSIAGFESFPFDRSELLPKVKRSIVVSHFFIPRNRFLNKLSYATFSSWNTG